MIYFYTINGLPVQTGDIICTTDGGKGLLGQFWWIVGKLIPGDVDHTVIYTGPNGKCVEAGAKGRVITFEIPSQRWDSEEMLAQRLISDEIYGIAYPCRNRGLTEREEIYVREDVAEYCLKQAEMQKPYNFNLLNSSTEDAFYCGQLAYAAYLRHGIDFNTGKGIPDIPGTGSIIFPQEIWDSCEHKKAAEY